MLCCTKHSRAWLWTQLFPLSLTYEHASMLLHKLHQFNSCTVHHWMLSSMPPTIDELYGFLKLEQLLMGFKRFTHLFNTELHVIFFSFPSILINWNSSVRENCPFSIFVSMLSQRYLFYSMVYNLILSSFNHSDCSAMAFKFALCLFNILQSL